MPNKSAGQVIELEVPKECAKLQLHELAERFVDVSYRQPSSYYERSTERQQRLE